MAAQERFAFVQRRFGRPNDAYSREGPAVATVAIRCIGSLKPALVQTRSLRLNQGPNRQRLRSQTAIGMAVVQPQQRQRFIAAQGVSMGASCARPRACQRIARSGRPYLRAMDEKHLTFDTHQNRAALIFYGYDGRFNKGGAGLGRL